MPHHHTTVAATPEFRGLRIGSLPEQGKKADKTQPHLASSRTSSAKHYYGKVKVQETSTHEASRKWNIKTRCVGKH
eukprot:6312441-Amphidinium_carterae.1